MRGFLFDGLLFKSNGVLMQGQHAEDRDGQWRALSPGEMFQYFDPEGDGALTENPFHIDSTTGESLRGDPAYDCRDVYEAAIEGMLHHLITEKPELKAHQDELRVDLRKMMNGVANEFNNLKMDVKPHTDDLYPHERSGYGRFSEPVPGSARIFTDVKNGTLHPDLARNLNVYVPKYQKIVASGVATHPSEIRLKNSRGQFTTINHSNMDHNLNGHMSEGGFLGLLPLLLEKYSGKYGVEAPHTMAYGYIKPEEYVIHTDRNDKRSNFWRFWHDNQDPKEGNAPYARGHKQHGEDSLQSVLSTLHPSFFQPYKDEESAHFSQTIPERRLRYAHDILGSWGTIPVNEETVRAFAASPVMHMLDESYIDESPIRSDSMTYRMLNLVREKVGLPRWLVASSSPNVDRHLPTDLPEETRNLNRWYNRQVQHMGIADSAFENDPEAHPHAGSGFRAALLNALMLSHMLNMNPAASKAVAAARGDTSGMAWGNRVREQFRTSYNAHPPKPTPSAWVDTSGPDPKATKAPRYETGEWQEPMAEAERPGPPPAPAAMAQVRPDALPPASPTPERPTVPVGGQDFPLFRLMESLQSSEARLDIGIVKSLPTARRYSIEDSYDRRELCNHYGLDDVDLHYINQSLGDWNMVAERLNVKPDVVKAVKIALRW